MSWLVFLGKCAKALPYATCIVILPNGLCSSHGVHRQRKSTGYCWLSSNGTPSIVLGSSGPSVQAPGATSMQAPGATSIEAQLLFRAEGLMTGSRGTSGSAPVWAILNIVTVSCRSISTYIFSSCSLSLCSIIWRQ
jgi:hypothetical protein